MRNKPKETPPAREWSVRKDDNDLISLHLYGKDQGFDAEVNLRVRRDVGDILVAMENQVRGKSITRHEWASLIPTLISCLEQEKCGRITAWIWNDAVGEMMDKMGARAYEEEHKGEKKMYRELTIEQLKNAAQRLSHWV